MRLRAPFRILVVVGTVAALATVASASAPPDQYGSFGPDTPVIYDNFTKLSWQRDAPTSLVAFDDAVAYCQTFGLGGFSWRVPSYKELETLVDEYPHTEYTSGVGVQVFIDGYAFFGTPTDQPFWTSSLVAGNPALGYVVDFGSGNALNQGVTVPQHVRCVTP